MGGKSSSGNKTTNNTTNTNINSNFNSNSSDVDNSQQISSSSNTTSTNINQQTTTNVNNTDNSTSTAISSNSNTNNVDNSTTVNNNLSGNVTQNMQKCGLDASQTENLLVNINESININNNASNTFIVTGNNNTISDVQLNSMLESYGPNINKDCVQNVVNDMQSKQDTTNSNDKSTAGSSLGVDLSSGGNTTSTSNSNSGRNANSTDSSNSTTGTARNSNQLTNSANNANRNDNSTANKSDQKSTASATGGQMGIGQASGAGADTDFGSILLIVVLIAVVLLISGGIFTVVSQTTDAPIAEQTGGFRGMCKLIVMTGYLGILSILLLAILNKKGRVLSNYRNLGKYLIIIGLLGILAVNFVENKLMLYSDFAEIPYLYKIQKTYF